jgi:hypothetical protein
MDIERKNDSAVPLIFFKNTVTTPPIVNKLYYVIVSRDEKGSHDVNMVDGPQILCSPLHAICSQSFCQLK